MRKPENWMIDYIDSMAIVDRNFKVIHSSRYNPRFDEESLENLYRDYIGKNFFDVYPNLSQDRSSMYQAIKHNEVVYHENQIFTDYTGRVFNTQNITIPIVRRGEVVGAVELSKDVTSINDLEKASSGIWEQSMDRKSDSDETTITFDQILTVNEEMRENIRKAKIFAASSSAAMVYGETGTGKELYVQAMVNHSGCPRQRFKVLNCAAVPESLFESILFGSVKGAYTGAVDRTGIFEQANRGILFLDELNSMPIQIQAKLLRVLQDGYVRKLGSEKEKRIQVKVIAAMNRDPLEAIENGTLREDLFFRLSSNLIRLTPLRERREDILVYVEHFIQELNRLYHKEIQGISGTMRDLFMAYDWKGNVREIKHILESMISTTDEKVLTVRDLPLYMKGRIDQPEKVETVNGFSLEPMTTLAEALEKTERNLISQTLIRTNGHLTKAAELLDIPRQTLKYRMDKWEIKQKQFKKDR